MKLLNALISTVIISACSSNNGENNSKKGLAHDEIELPQDNDDPKPEQCLEYEQQKEDGSCYYLCRTDANEKEWCLRQFEFPSDTDPTKKTRACSSGMLDNDQCKPISFEMNKEFKLKAGDNTRMHADGSEVFWNQLILGGDLSGTGKILHYSFMTRYPAVMLETMPDSFSRFSVHPERVSFDLYQDIKENKDYLPISFNYYGTKFKTGSMKLEEFENLCKELDENIIISEVF